MQSSGKLLLTLHTHINPTLRVLQFHFHYFTINIEAPNILSQYGGCNLAERETISTQQVAIDNVVFIWNNTHTCICDFL